MGAATLFSAAAHAQTSLPSQLELARLVDLSAQRLSFRVTYDEASLKGKISFRADKPLSDNDLWKLTNRLLAEQGMTTIRAGDDETIAVVKIAQAAQAARVEAIADLRSNPAGVGTVSVGFRRVLVPLKVASGKDVTSTVQLVLSKPGGVIAESEQGGFVIVADLTPYLETALSLIEQLDGDQSGLGGAVVREVSAKNVDAQRLATLAKQLADKRKQVGGRELRGDIVPAAGGSSVLLIAPPAFLEGWESILAAVDQREAVERRTYAVSTFGLKEVANLIEQTVRTSVTGSGTAAAGDDRWRLIQDDLTGTLIITATPSQHEQIAQLIDRLSEIPIEARRPVRTFKVKNRGVKELQQVVEDLVRAGVLDAAASAVDDNVRGAGAQVSTRAFGPGGATAPPRDSNAAGGVLGETESSAQTVANGYVVPSRVGAVSGNSSITLTADEATNTLIVVGEPRLLAQLEQLIPTLDVRQPQVMMEAMLISLSDSQSLDFGVELERLRVSGETMIRLSSLFGLSSAGAAGGERIRNVGDGSGFTGTVLNPGDFSVVIRALETINQGRSLSRPKVLVNNNQQASFNSVLQQPFSSTNASNTVSTTSFGGTQDAGTTISVKPQIAEGDHLVLTYSISLSSFVGAAANANLPPPRQQNSIQSIATIPDGFTVVVGGLELTTSGDGKSQIPGIGSIPLIGELFKNQAKSSGRQRFYVFLRANVMRNSSLEDLKYASDRAAEAVNVPTDWPQVEPRVIR